MYIINIFKLFNFETNSLMDIDKENKKIVNFEQVGRVLTVLGIFRIIQYSEEFKCKIHL